MRPNFFDIGQTHYWTAVKFDISNPPHVNKPAGIWSQGWKRMRKETAHIARAASFDEPHVPASVCNLAAGAMHAAVRPHDGGRLASLWREAPGNRRTDVLVPLAAGSFDPLVWPKAGTYPLVPYSNRIRNAAFRFGETLVQLASHPATAPHSLHGFCQQRPWSVTAQTATQVEMRYRHEPAHAPDAWPWAFEAIQRIMLDPTGLIHEIGVESRADTPMPMGLGIHPYFAVSIGDRFQFKADAIWEADADGCGRRLRAFANNERLHDLRHGAMETTIYYAGWNGTASLHRQDGTTIVMETAAPLDHLVVHAPSGGAYLCLEPVSHVADAFNLAPAGLPETGMRVLHPGETLWASMRITVT
ncbi:aldose 1-epimerase [Bradyrhizobium manausense]|uniref:aldose 1-epimerase n=1 Tax=Bradyrhizobium manausense TaxID=989370 RepID=UPI001BA7D7DD|nr:aldose 1-epimerase [Bradyrhizobium manausense]MBR0832329.1 aldose 1-epimerase [Bradyrhizobium manausense]